MTIRQRFHLSSWSFGIHSSNFYPAFLLHSCWQVVFSSSLRPCVLHLEQVSSLLHSHYRDTRPNNSRPVVAPTPTDCSELPDGGMKSKQLGNIYSDAGRRWKKVVIPWPSSFDRSATVLSWQTSKVILQNHHTTAQSSENPNLHVEWPYARPTVFILGSCWAVLSTALHRKAQFMPCAKTKSLLNL